MLLEYDLCDKLHLLHSKICVPTINEVSVPALPAAQATCDLRTATKQDPMVGMQALHTILSIREGNAPPRASGSNIWLLQLYRCQAGSPSRYAASLKLGGITLNATKSILPVHLEQPRLKSRATPIPAP